MKLNERAIEGVDMRNPLWSLDEALILLDAVSLVQRGETSRDQAVQDVSDKLRNRARGQGLVVDDTFRSAAKVGRRMKGMEYLYTRGQLGSKDVAGKLFKTAYALYASNRSLYDVLQRRIEATQEPSLQSLFFDWLGTILSQEKVQLARKTIGRIDPLWQEYSDSLERWYDAVDPAVVQNARQKIKESDAGSKLVLQLLELYERFLINLNKRGKQNKKSKSTQITPHPKFANTVPTSCSYKGEDIPNVKTWARLYVDVAKRLYQDYPEVFQPLVYKSFIDANGAAVFILASDYRKLRKPLKLGSGMNAPLLECDHDEQTAVSLLLRLRTLCPMEKGALRIKFKSIRTLAERSDSVTKSETESTAKAETAPATMLEAESAIKSETAAESMSAPKPASNAAEFLFDLKTPDDALDIAPVSCVFRGEKIEFKQKKNSAWAKLYVALLQSLFRTHRFTLLPYVNKKIGGSRYLLVDWNNRDYATAPRSVVDNIYAETSFSQPGIVKKICFWLAVTGVDYSELQIYCKPFRKRTYVNDEPSEIAYPSATAYTPERQCSEAEKLVQTDFKFWLLATGVPLLSLDAYIEKIDALSTTANSCYFTRDSLWSLDLQRLEVVKDKLVRVPQVLPAPCGGSILEVLEKYLRFRRQYKSENG